MTASPLRSSPAARRALLGALLLSAAATPARAQEAAPRWQFRVASGSLVPTGAQRDAHKRAPVLAAQLSRTLAPTARKMALPMAGICDEVMPPMMRAMVMLPPFAVFP